MALEIPKDLIEALQYNNPTRTGPTEITLTRVSEPVAERLRAVLNPTFGFELPAGGATLESLPPQYPSVRVSGTVAIKALAESGLQIAGYEQGRGPASSRG